MIFYRYRKIFILKIIPKYRERDCRMDILSAPAYINVDVYFAKN